MLKNADGAMNAGLSLAAIISGGLGAIAAGEETAKALSGTSSIFSGSRAALNEVYLTNQTIHVLASAYEKARQAQRQAIANRQQCDTAQYTIMRGIEDAFSYHAACSVVVGLAETARAIERADNPGLDTMRKSLAELSAFQAQAAEFTRGRLPIPIMGPKPTLSLESVTQANELVQTKRDAYAAAEAARQEARVASIAADTAFKAATDENRATLQDTLRMAEKTAEEKEQALRQAATELAASEKARDSELQRLSRW